MRAQVPESKDLPKLSLEDVPIWLPRGCQLREVFERSRGLRQLGKDLPTPRMRSTATCAVLSGEWSRWPADVFLFEPISGQNFPSSSPLINATPNGHVTWVLVLTVVIAVRVASLGALKPSSSPPSPLPITPVAPL